MSGAPQVPISQRRVLFDREGTEAIRVRRDLEFVGADGSPLPFDLYLPPPGGRPPVVLVAEGYPEAGFQRVVGCAFREMEPVASWARLLAVAGLAVVVGSNRRPSDDALALLRHVRGTGAELGLDASRLGVWASSGNAPVGLSLLFAPDAAVRCAAFLYPYLLDLDGAAEVSQAAATFHFDDACAGRSLGELPAAVPLLVARAGRDETPGLNASLDRFVARAFASQLPLTLVDHAAGPHAFDLFHDSAATRAVVRQIVDFMSLHLEI